VARAALAPCKCVDHPPLPLRVVLICFQGRPGCPWPQPASLAAQTPVVPIRVTWLAALFWAADLLIWTILAAVGRTSCCWGEDGMCGLLILCSPGS
jgi:hypothetical protein